MPAPGPRTVVLLVAAVAAPVLAVLVRGGVAPPAATLPIEHEAVQQEPTARAWDAPELEASWFDAALAALYDTREKAQFQMRNAMLAGTRDEAGPFPAAARSLDHLVDGLARRPPPAAVAHHVTPVLREADALRARFAPALAHERGLPAVDALAGIVHGVDALIADLRVVRDVHDALRALPPVSGERGDDAPA